MFRSLMAIGMLGMLMVTESTMADTPTARRQMIDLPKAVHFVTPSGDKIVLGPGTYEIEAVDQGLRLKPKDGKAEDAKVIKASPLEHGETLEEPKTVSEEVSEDTHGVALLSPGGAGLETFGSYSGIQSRAVVSVFNWWLRQTDTNVYTSPGEVLHLYNTTVNLPLVYVSFYGLKLANSSNTNVYWHRQIGTGSTPTGYLQNGELIALNVYGAGWLRCCKERLGIDLNSSNSPVYEWRFRSQVSEPTGAINSVNYVSLWNEVKKDYLVYCKQTFGNTVKWARECQ